MSNDWTDPTLRGIKRELSLYEKATLPTRQGRALLLPGEPPRREGEASEVEDLIRSGYNPHFIYGVEQDQDLAVDLYDYYYDEIHIHLEEAGEFLRRSRGGFSYIHLDFCVPFNQDSFDTIQSWLGRVTPIARVRVSSYGSRRAAPQLEYEMMIRRTILQRLIDECAQLDDNADRWKRYWAALEESDDSTQIHLGIMFLNFFFGTDSWRWADSCLIESHLPQVKGAHRLANIRRFSYSEPGGHNSIMFTSWVDLVPHRIDTMPGDKNAWLLNEIANFFAAITTPLPRFIPEFFQEDK